MEKPVLLVIDVQNYFMNQHTRSLPAKIAAHAASGDYGAILFTTFVNNNESNFVKMLGWDKCHSPPDTDICKELAHLANGNNTFEKHTLSAFKSKKLVAHLKDLGAKSLYLCGTDSEACVLSSAFEAFDMGFDVHILKDLCASTNGTMFHDYARTIIERNLEPYKG